MADAAARSLQYEYKAVSCLLCAVTVCVSYWAIVDDRQQANPIPQGQVKMRGYGADLEHGENAGRIYRPIGVGLKAAEQP